MAILLLKVFFHRRLTGEFSLYNRNATVVIPQHVVISACRDISILTAATDIRTAVDEGDPTVGVRR
jgi:hypothetical protein